MSGQKKDRNFFERGNISEMAMITYLNNGLSAEEKQRFEQLLERDPFAREALEGLQQASASTTVSASIASLQSKVRDRAGIKEAGMWGDIRWTNYAWAAALLGVLVGIGIVMIGFLNNPAEKLSMDQQLEQVPPAAPDLIQAEGAVENTSTEVPAERSETTTGAATLPTIVFPAEDNKIGLQDDNTSLSKQEVVSDDFKVTANDVRLSSADREKAKAEENNLSVRKNTVVESGAPVEAQEKKIESMAADVTETPTSTQRVVRGAIMEKEEIDRVTVVTLEDAMKNFNSGNYKKSAEMFAAIVTEQPSNADALYYGGISDYILGNDRRSEKNFDKLLKNGSKYIDGSKWYKALLLLKKGKKSEALILLNELSESNSSYKERAVKKKAEIKF